MTKNVIVNAVFYCKILHDILYVTYSLWTRVTVSRTNKTKRDGLTWTVADCFWNFDICQSGFGSTTSLTLLFLLNTAPLS